jgi:uncharacterized membrane protein
MRKLTKKERDTIRRPAENTLNSLSMIISLIVIGVIIFCMKLDATMYVEAYVVIAGIVILTIVVKVILQSREKRLWFKKKKKEGFFIIR